jgi:hypothetical protein
MAHYHNNIRKALTLIELAIAQAEDELSPQIRQELRDLMRHTVNTSQAYGELWDRHDRLILFTLAGLYEAKEKFRLILGGLAHEPLGPPDLRLGKQRREPT